MKQIKAVVFDLDGTLLDTIHDLMDSVNEALAAFGQPQRTLEQIKQSVGNGVHHLFETSIPQGTQNIHFDEAFALLLELYKKHSLNKTKPFDGIIEMLGKLKASGIKCAVVSNKPDNVVQEIMPLYFPDTFEYYTGEKPSVKRKPAPDLVFECLEKMKIEKENAVYAGDSETDILTARNAGMECIACSWGYRKKETLIENGAKIIVNTPSELEQIVLNLSHSEN